MILDTSGVLAAIDGSQRRHEQCAAALEAAEGPLLLSPFVLAELDYLICRRVGGQARMALLDEVARGSFQLEPVTGADVAAARDVVASHGDLGLSLADASIVVLAERTGSRDVLTLDERDFRAVKAAVSPLRLLPADA